MSTNGAQPGLLVPATSTTLATPGANHTADRGPTVDKCTHIDVNYDPTVAVICSLYICFGILYSFFGYRCFKIVMFLTGFIFGSVIVYLICLQEALLPPYGNAGVALCAGLLFGLITMLVQYVGLFMTGLHTGLLLGLGSLAAADHLLERPGPRHGSVWLCVGVLLASAVLFAILNLYWRKGLTVLGTSLYGGAILSASVDYFVERLSLVQWLWDRVSLRPVAPPPCWFSWIVLATWPAIVLAGLVTQCALTGRGVHHIDTIGGRKKPRASMQRPRTRAERAELRQKKYRYLYQVRTAHGDVISQNYVQALQKKEAELGGGAGLGGGLGSGNGAGECSTLQSDATHLTILPDAQLAALTESEDDSQTEIATQR